ncbi:MAG: NAD-dependent epimerase/dehydratase family protein [Polyangiaceae bacterium]
MIVFNGSTGGLGRFFAAAAERRGLIAYALQARLESREDLRSELHALSSPSSTVTLLQMAARVSVPACEADEAGTFRTNVGDCRDTVLDFAAWAKSRTLSPRVVYVSSGHVYAALPHGERTSELAPTAPRSVYARSKLAAEQELQNHAASAGYQLTIARVFGLIAPSQPANYLLPGLLRRVRSGELAGIPGLDNFRDYLDARDVCDALLDLAARDAGQAPLGTVNVCSGDGVSVRAILSEVAAVLRPSEAESLLRQATAAVGRPDDVPWLVGDPSKMSAAFGRSVRQRSLRDTIVDAA